MSAGWIVLGLLWAGIMGYWVLQEIRGNGTTGRAVVRNIGVWALIFTLLYGLFLYRAELGTLWERARADITGTPTADAVGGTLTLRVQPDGHYWASARGANGNAVSFLVDTGASTVLLSSAAAATLGAEQSGGYPVMVDTANGRALMQRGRLASLDVGGVVVRDLDVLISDQADGVSVLGMNWLSRMESWRVAGNEMRIEP